MITTRIFSGKLRHILRHLSTAATTTAAAAAAASTTSNMAGNPSSVRKEEVFRRLYDAGSAGGRVSNVLHGIMYSTGKPVTKNILIQCLKDLRKLGRYHQCLEILDWLEKGKFGSSGADFALRLDILYKLKGLDEVEKYFDGIPSDLKNHSVYGGLLSCYTKALATDKALATFRKMDEMGFPPHVLAFNNLLSLFVKVNQPEKVSELVAEMKDKNVPLNGHSYSFWIQSYRLLGDLEGVGRVFQEAIEQTFLKDDWVIYSNVATAFIELNQFEKAISCLGKLESALDNSANTNRDGYHHLLSLYASAGKLESVIRVWNKLKAKFKVADNASSLLFLIALSKLDDIKCLETHFREWELSSEKYDDGIAAVLIGAYLKHDMLEEAKLLIHDATKKAGKTLHMPHVKFLNYYFEKGQTDCALHHMEAAISSKWKPRSEKLDPCFQHFKDAKDVEGVEIFCQLLKKAQALDARGYLWMLQTYVDAGKTALDMRSRMEEDGIDISPELEELLEQVCPK